MAVAGLLAVAIPPGLAVGAEPSSPRIAVEALRDRVEVASALSASERTQMLANLDEILLEGIEPEALQFLFPGTGRELSAAGLLRLQAIVLETARQGLSTDLILAKTREGRIKGVPEVQLVQAGERMCGYVRSAERILEYACCPDMDACRLVDRKHMRDEISLQLWRGLPEPAYMNLCDAAARNPVGGVCAVEDLVAAGEVAVRLVETGVNTDRALKFACETIRRGYREREMRHIQLMVVASHRQGREADELMRSMEYCVDIDMRPGEMYEYLARKGWMGPGGLGRPDGQGPPPAGRKGNGGVENIEEIERGRRQGGGGRNG